MLNLGLQTLAVGSLSHLNQRIHLEFSSQLILGHVFVSSVKDDIITEITYLCLSEENVPIRTLLIKHHLIS